MLPLAGMLFNVVAGLIVDKAQDLAEEHVGKMIDDLLPDSAKKELDKIVKDDDSHSYDNAKDALMGAVEGKLPIPLKDGKLLPIEMDFKVVFDPNSKTMEILQK
jgi:hypothetical protein